MRIQGVRRSRGVLPAALAGALLASGASAQTSPVQQPSITVEGQASGDVPPDAAQLEVGVDADRSSAAAATAEVSRAAQAVTEAIRTAGIDDKDVRTTSVGLVPVYPDEVAVPPSGQSRLPRSYLASTTITLTVRPPDRAGTILAELVDKGVTSIGGVAFTAAGQDQMRDMLRGDAMRDARRKADLYVQALGLHLVDVIEILPEEGAGPAPLAYARAEKSILASPPIPVVPGPIHVREAVRVRWSIGP